MIDFDLGGMTGRYLGRFRDWLNRTPRKDFHEASVAAKVGRILLIGGAVVIILTPLIWLVR